MLQLRLGRLAKRLRAKRGEAADDLVAAQEAASEIEQVTKLLRNVVRPVSTQYLRGTASMIDLKASVTDDEGMCKPSETTPRVHAHSRNRDE